MRPANLFPRIHCANGLLIFCSIGSDESQKDAGISAAAVR